MEAFHCTKDSLQWEKKIVLAPLFLRVYDQNGGKFFVKIG